MSPHPSDAISKLDRKAGAPESSLKDLVRNYGPSLPGDYLDFLRKANGAEGLLGPAAYVSIWPAEEVQRRNQGYGVAEFAPGLILFGSDGGGTGFAFDTRQGTPWRIVDVPLAGMDLNDVRQIATSFEGFLIALAGRMPERP